MFLVIFVNLWRHQIPTLLPFNSRLEEKLKYIQKIYFWKNQDRGIWQTFYNSLGRENWKDAFCNWAEVEEKEKEEFIILVEKIIYYSKSDF